MGDDVVLEWTGRSAQALQAALRMSNMRFAEHLGIAVRTVAGWHAKPDIVPRPELQQLLDTSHEQADNGARRRFALLSRGGAGEPTLAAEVALLQARVDYLQEQLAARQDPVSPPTETGTRRA